MNRVISWLNSIRLRQLITVLLVSLTVFVGTAFDLHGNPLQAQAQKVSASTKAERIREDAEKSAKLLAKEGIQVKNQAAGSTQEASKNPVNNIRAKLNLDEPIDPGTKQVGEEIKDTLTGKD
ncbi:MAG: hypothetical protein JOZ78_25155 [Chroococcidiopsidaceae cyanobacterium CP_BM_ER_R8_30]|nr:hypothetical protein [Chroococcidiopsidaceae cyanobacterium CP_BM_ER_R8_30]